MKRAVQILNRAEILPTFITAAAFYILIARGSCSGQTTGGGAASGPASAAASVVFEPGDVYLPNSRIYVFVGKTGFGHEHAVAGKIKRGRVLLDAPSDAGGLVFDMSSFAADTPEARKYIGLQGPTDASTQQQVTANMLGPDVLNVARYSTASFTIKSVTRLPQPSKRGLPQYQLAGDFALHGVIRPTQVIADAEEQSGWIHLRCEFTMLQSTFGIKPFSKAFGALGVTDQLTVWGDFWISKQRQVAALPTTSR